MKDFMFQSLSSSQFTFAMDDYAAFVNPKVDPQVFAFVLDGDDKGADVETLLISVDCNDLIGLVIIDIRAAAQETIESIISFFECLDYIDLDSYEDRLCYAKRKNLYY